ncbi:membrane protein [Oscillospiraceae bacterium]|nr:membrane protein [Oscillospiraceae bacterium]BDF73172.1 membrane protein [Oscillospiraceae bacterium]
MKKYINIAFVYAILAMAGGVFYREFTKLNGFTGRTALSFVHTHLFLLGMVVFLLAALFAGRLALEGCRLWRPFLVVYNLGVAVTALLLAVRGVAQVLSLPLSRGADAAISGVAGLGHILTGVGLVFFFLCLRRCARDEQA